MIEQVMGHRSFKWLQTINSNPMINFIHHPSFPKTTEVLNKEFEDRCLDRVRITYHRPEVIKTLPKPNNSMPALESSPHIWHFRDTDTEIEFLVFSDGLRKNHYKGTSIEVMFNNDSYQLNDEKLASAYSNLLDYFSDCYYGVTSLSG